MGLTKWTLGSWTAYMGEPASPDPYGCVWLATFEDGWRTPPPPRIERVVRPRRHGEIDPGRTWLAARTVELRGFVEAPNHEALAAAGERFAALLADGLLTDLVVDEDGAIKVAAARLNDAPGFTLIHPSLATWTLPLLMPDPLRYGAASPEGEEITISTGLPVAGVGLTVPMTAGPLVIEEGGTEGRIQLTNNGTAATRPRFRIDGPVTNPRIEHPTTGRTLTFMVNLAAGSYLDIRPLTGEVVLNGSVNARNFLTNTSAPVSSVVMPTGPNEIFFRALSSPGGASLTVAFRPAYY